jgi:hypothetical protein
MSGFDTSQPITDEKVLQDVDTDDESTEKEAAEATDADELGDATPGPR